MNKKTRLVILLCCVVCFFVIAPVLVLYSEGYRLDLKKMAIVATGGIYVRTFPAADKVTIDYGIVEKPGLFANSIFVQSLLPESHTVSIQKSGYYDYFKTLPVKEKEVTKLENVLLFKKSLAFSTLESKITYFSISPNNQNIITASTGTSSTTFNYFSLNDPKTIKTFSILNSGTISDIKWSNDSSRALISIGDNFYYLFNTTSTKLIATRQLYLDKSSQEIYFSQEDPQTIFYLKNKTLYSEKANLSTPIIKNVAAFKLSGNNIEWMSTTGALSDSDTSGKLTGQAASTIFKLDLVKTYKLLSVAGNTYLQTNNALFLLNPDTKMFENFNVPISNYKITASGDGKNLIFWNDDKVYLYDVALNKFAELYSGSQISDLQWLNDSYIIFNNGDKIVISEIDYRGNINTVDISKPAEEIFFNYQDGKVYILTQNTLISSDKITP